MPARPMATVMGPIVAVVGLADGSAEQRADAELHHAISDEAVPAMWVALQRQRPSSWGRSG